VVHSTALNSSDNLPFYPPHNHHSMPSDVCRRGRDLQLIVADGKHPVICKTVASVSNYHEVFLF